MFSSSSSSSTSFSSATIAVDSNNSACSGAAPLLVAGTSGGPSAPSLSRQPSMFPFRQDELQKCIIGPTKTFGSMTMDDEFIKNVWATDGQAMGATAAMLNLQNSGGLSQQPSLQSQNSLSLLRTLSGKSVDDLWRHIQPKSEEGPDEHQHPQQPRQQQQLLQPPPPIRQGTPGEMTLGDFLVRTGVVKDDGEMDAKGNLPLYPIPSLHASALDQNSSIQTDWMNFTSRQPHQQFLQHAEAVARRGPNMLLSCNQDEFNTGLVPTNSLAVSPAISDYSMHPRKRGGEDIVVERSLERRQRRMIKNRESAARSRARRQAYTMELESEVTQLKEENAKLKRLQALGSRISQRSQPPPRVLRRTQSCPYF